MIKVKHLAKTFTMHTRDGAQVQGFADISFSVEKGELLALSGPSGSGKSSILKTMYGTYLASAGDVIISHNHTQYNITKATLIQILQLREEAIGYISQFLQVLPRVSTVDIVAKPLICSGELEQTAQETAKQLLSDLGIKEELFTLSPLTFSGGEQQRVNIAKGIIAPKDLLLLDEPTASLDVHNTNIVVDKLQVLKAQGKCLIGIFHDTSVMQNLADKIYNPLTHSYE